MTMMRRRRNEINDLKVDGVQVVSVHDIRECIKEYFKLHFKQDSLPQISLLLSGFRRINDLEASSLEVAPIIEEVRNAL